MSDATLAWLEAETEALRVRLIGAGLPLPSRVHVAIAEYLEPPRRRWLAQALPRLQGVLLRRGVMRPHRRPRDLEVPALRGVVVHELCHLAAPPDGRTHGPAFWAACHVAAAEMGWPGPAMPCAVARDHDAHPKYWPLPYLGGFMLRWNVVDAWRDAHGEPPPATPRTPAPSIAAAEALPAPMSRRPCSTPAAGALWAASAALVAAWPGMAS